MGQCLWRGGNERYSINASESWGCVFVGEYCLHMLLADLQLWMYLGGWSLMGRCWWELLVAGFWWVNLGGC